MLSKVIQETFPDRLTWSNPAWSRDPYKVKCVTFKGVGVQGGATRDICPQHWQRQ